MLAIESPKPHVIARRNVAKIEKERYNGMNDIDRRKTSRDQGPSQTEAAEELRDGAVNRTVETSSYIKKNQKRSPKNNISINVVNSKLTGKKNMVLYKQTTGVLKDDSSTGLKKKSRLNGHPDVLKIGLGTLDTSKPARPRMKSETDNSETKRRCTPEEKSNSNSFSDFSQLDREQSDSHLKRLTSAANRPKSAGQAMLMNDYSSDSDDSFYDGEIELVDLDDPVFAYGLEFERSKPGPAQLSNTAAGQGQAGESNSVSTPRSDYHDNANKHTVISIKHEMESGEIRPKSDRVYDAQPRPSTSHGRRRAQSEPEVKRTSMIPVKTGLRQSNSTKRNPQKYLGDYTKTVDRVISKYSGMNVKKVNATFPKPTGTQFPNTDMYQARAPLPRKLKPILRREKLSNVSSDTR